MSETTGTDQYDPNDHTVPEVQEYLATADDTERDRVLAAERDGQARVGIVGPADTGDQPDAGQDVRDGTTTGQTFTDAAAAATPADVGFIGASAERDRTGREDKGLSQRNPAILRGGPIPDSRPGVDDTEGLNALREG